DVGAGRPVRWNSSDSWQGRLAIANAGAAPQQRRLGEVTAYQEPGKRSTVHLRHEHNESVRTWRARGSIIMTYTLVFRRYAPFEAFGGGFEGDGRTGPSTRLTDTARTSGIIGFAPGRVGELKAGSSGTAFNLFGPAVS